MRLQRLRLGAKTVLALIAARRHHQTFIDSSRGVADHNCGEHADLMLQHILQRSYNRLLAVTVGTFDNANSVDGSR